MTSNILAHQGKGRQVGIETVSLVEAVCLQLCELFQNELAKVKQDFVEYFDSVTKKLKGKK